MQSAVISGLEKLCVEFASEIEALDAGDKQMLALFNGEKVDVSDRAIDSLQSWRSRCADLIRAIRSDTAATAAPLDPTLYPDSE